LTSEGIKLEEITPPYPTEPPKKGDTGSEIQLVQYYLAVIGYFNAAVPLIAADGVFGEKTENAVRQFQLQYGLTPNGTVDAPTWDKMREIYDGIVSSLPAGFYQGKMPIYPGYMLKKGLENESVRMVQQALSALRSIYPSIPSLSVTGYFGDQTDAAVRAFQKIFGLPQNGNVGPITWNKLATEYDAYRGLQ
ncbi:MAG: peptidoglycan-binding protein, partial [Angelakisella sp.]